VRALLENQFETPGGGELSNVKRAGLGPLVFLPQDPGPKSIAPCSARAQFLDFKPADGRASRCAPA
jgi:hypothetical protein